MKTIYDTDQSRFTLRNRLKAYGLIFLMLVQVWMPVSAAVLQSTTIQYDLENNPEFQRVFDAVMAQMYQYSAPNFASQDSPGSATDIATFRQQLLAQSPHVVNGAVANSAKFVGTPAVQARYIRSQIYTLLGRQLIDAESSDFANETAQLNHLYANTLAYVNDTPNLTYGQQLNVGQENNGYGLDFVWPELRTINGEEVLVPIVYFSEETYRERKVSDHDIQFGGNTTFGSIIVNDVNVKFGRQAYLNVVNDLVNNQGGIYGEGDLQIVAGGTLQNLSGAIDANGDLKIAAHNVVNQTLVHRWDYGDRTGGEFGEISTLSADGSVMVRSSGNIILRGASVQAGDEIMFGAEGSIYIGTVPVSETFSGTVNGWRTQTSSVDYLGSSLSAENTIKLIANGEIKIDGSEILSSQGHIDLLAGMGITIEDELNSFQSHRKGKFGKTSKEETAYKTVAMRSVLDAGLGIRLNTEYGDITLKGVDISSTEGTSVSASNGAVNMLMAVETDQYNYSSITKKLFTIKTVNRGHNIETSVPNTIVGGFQAEALYGLNVEYEGNPDLTFDEQIDVLGQMPGLEWMAEVRGNPEYSDINWEEVNLVYDEWNKTKTTLSPAALAVITIVVAVCTAGAGAAVAGAVAAEGSVLYAAIAAGVSSLISQAAVALANGAVDGDIAGGLESLASEDTFKNLVVAMVTAGAIAAIDAQFFTPPDEALTEVANATEAAALARGATEAQAAALVDLAEDAASRLTLGQQALQVVTHTAAQAGINSMVYGGDFEDQFVTSLLQTGVDILGQHMASEIGQAFDHGVDPSALNTALKYISHAGAGCIIGAATAANGGDGNAESACLSGAGGAVVGEIIATRYRTSSEVLDAQQAIDDFMSENVAYIISLGDLGFNGAEIKAILQSTTDLKYYSNRLNDLKQKGVDLARLGAAIGAFAAGAEASNINIAADLGANAAENNALFLVFALPIVLTAIDIALTGADLLEIYEAYEKGDTDEGNRLLAIFVGSAAVGAFIPGDKILSEIIEYAAKNGKNLGKNAKAIIEYVESKVSPSSGRIDNVDVDLQVRSHNSNGGRGGNSNPLNAPEPNSVYHVDGKYRYQTDANGNVTNVNVELDELSQGARSCYQQRLAGSCGLDGDEGGHLIGAQFGGPGERINLVPQDANLNRGAGSPWREMEQSWVDAIGEGSSVNVNMRLEYPTDSVRPDKFVVEYTIDGVDFVKEFLNLAGG